MTHGDGEETAVPANSRIEVRLGLGVESAIRNLPTPMEPAPVVGSYGWVSSHTRSDAQLACESPEITMLLPMLLL